MQTWRLIPSIKASGTVQMAIDQWLFDQHRLANHPPTLRFYTWSPVAISLGYHQHQFPEAWKQITWQGDAIDLVRRPSGGRAVLHQGDLTYAVITSGSGRRMQDYQMICEFLISGWRSLGVDLYYGTARRGYLDNPNCFETATIADLVLEDGTKLIGSAQLRKGDAILQHGSMRLTPDQKLHDRFESPAASRVLGASLLPQLLSAKTSISTVTEALIQAARNSFGIEFEIRSLTESEWQEIYTLL